MLHEKLSKIDQGEKKKKAEQKFDNERRYATSERKKQVLKDVKMQARYKELENLDK